jgi:hypothetical protein
LIFSPTSPSNSLLKFILLSISNISNCFLSSSHICIFLSESSEQRGRQPELSECLLLCSSESFCRSFFFPIFYALLVLFICKISGICLQLYRSCVHACILQLRKIVNSCSLCVIPCLSR